MFDYHTIAFDIVINSTQQPKALYLHRQSNIFNFTKYVD